MQHRDDDVGEVPAVEENQLHEIQDLVTELLMGFAMVLERRVDVQMMARVRLLVIHNRSLPPETEPVVCYHGLSVASVSAKEMASSEVSQVSSALRRVSTGVSQVSSALSRVLIGVILGLKATLQSA